MKTSRLRLMQGIAVLGLTLGTALPAHAATNLVGNGNFGTGDFTDWTLSGDNSEVYVAQVGPAMYAAALTTASDNGFLTQNLATVAGQEYTVAFSIQGDGGEPNSLLASLGGTTLENLTDVPFTEPSFLTYSDLFTASASSSLLSFTYRDDPGFIYLTDVSVTPVSVAPEPSTWVAMLVGLSLLAYGSVRTRRSA